MASKKSFLIYCDYKQHLALLTDEDKGRVLMAVFEYVETGAEPELEAAPMMAFSFIRTQLDRDMKKYEEKCRRRAEAGKKSGEARRAKAEQDKQEEQDEQNEQNEQSGTKETNVHFVEQNGTKRTDNGNGNGNGNGNEYFINEIYTGNSKELPEGKKPARFTPPTVEEVRAYCRERSNAVDPETFVDFYTGKGWMIGKNKMRDWKAAVRTWEKSEKDMPRARSRPMPSQPKPYSNPALAYVQELERRAKHDGA